MDYREIGKTGVEVSVISLGTWPMGGLVGGVIGEGANRKVDQGWSGSDDEQSIRTIRLAEDLGINFIHSSEAYGGGHAENIVGLALKGRSRDKFIIATKVRPLLQDDNPENARRRIREALEGSLRRLQTDYVDFHQLHTVPNADTIPAVMDEYVKLKQEGKVRHVAISTANIDGIRAVLAYGEVACIRVGHNMMNPIDPAVLAFTQQEGIGVVVLGAMASGILTGKWFGKLPEIDPMDKRTSMFSKPGTKAMFAKLKELEFLTQDGKRTMPQVAVRFVADTPGVTSVLNGAQRPEEIEENVRSMESPALTEEERATALVITAEANRLYQG